MARLTVRFCALALAAEFSTSKVGKYAENEKVDSCDEKIAAKIHDETGGRNHASVRRRGRPNGDPRRSRMHVRMLPAHHPSSVPDRSRGPQGGTRRHAAYAGVAREEAADAVLDGLARGLVT